MAKNAKIKETSIVKRKSINVVKKDKKPLKVVKKSFSIGQLELALLNRFPRETAFDWDKTGLLAGNSNEKVKKIAVALDPTVDAVKLAKNNGCNLLLTHHPAFIESPDKFVPYGKNSISSGSLIYEAISSGVALMNFHTALDVSKEGGSALPGLLNLSVKSVLCPVDGFSSSKSKLGIGRLCTVKKADKDISLKNFAARCTSVFGRAPRVWGDFSKKLNTIVTTTGSTGSLSDADGVLAKSLKKNIDCVVCGEIRYHDALALKDAGISIIDLGHDVSELPLASVLAACLVELGVDNNDIIMVDQSNNWNYQKSVKI